MLQAISKKLNNAVELFRPTDKNIELAFKGDDQLENFKAVNIAKNILVKQKILYIDSNGKIDEYAHRIGRTARGDATGVAISLFVESKDRRISRKLVKYLKKSEQKVEPWLQAIADSTDKSEYRG